MTRPIRGKLAVSMLAIALLGGCSPGADKVGIDRDSSITREDQKGFQDQAEERSDQSRRRSHGAPGTTMPQDR